jgi:hypothetical protein
MKSFLSRYVSLICFVLSDFDRLRFCGESRLLNHSRGVQSYLHQQRILFKDYPDHAQGLTRPLRRQTDEQAEQEGVHCSAQRPRHRHNALDPKRIKPSWFKKNSKRYQWSESSSAVSGQAGRQPH